MKLGFKRETICLMTLLVFKFEKRNLNLNVIYNNFVIYLKKRRHESTF